MLENPVYPALLNDVRRDA
jgi:hypothetical protein